MIRYIDFNRGSDSNDGSSPSLAWKTIAMMDNFLPGAGGGIFLACDSTWVVPQTRASSGSQSQTRFNGAEGGQSFITSYRPHGADTALKPTISRRMVPVPSDWTWDATDNFGAPRGWYIQLGYQQSQWDCFVEVNGELVGTTNQDTTNNTGLGYINGQMTGDHAGALVNGMTLDTMRFNFDIGGLSVGGSTGARIYLSGLGLRTPGEGKDPSSVLGPGAIKIAFGQMWGFWDSLNHTIISDVRAQDGSGLLLYQATPNTVRQGFEMAGCETYNTNTPVFINSGTGDVAATNWAIDIHDNLFEKLSGPAFRAYGVGVTGHFRRNGMVNGNLSSSMGGGVYAQLKPSMFGGSRAPFRVERNVADKWKNGAGNNTWDGGAYYADLQDQGTIFSNNIAKNSYVAFQCGSGHRSEWYGNKSLRCEYFGLFNNAAVVDTQDYIFAHNLHIAAARGTFSHGESADVHPYSFAVYIAGAAANFVGGKIINNVFINNPAQPNEIPLLAYQDAQWQSGKVVVSNNAFIGYSDRLVVSDFNASDKTSVSPSVATTMIDAKFDSEWRISAGSSLCAKGASMDGIAVIDDFDGRPRYDPPSIGPHEVQRRGDWFGNF